MTKKTWIIIGVVVVLILLWIGGAYNGFVRLNETVNRQWADVETQYQRRVDLIPNLVSTVKGAATFEQSTFLAVTEARTKWLNAQATPGNDDDLSAARGVDSALARLLVTVENHPNLKANASFLDLQSQLEGTENRVAVARQRYNEGVRAYNTKTKTFPSNVIAGVFNFDARTFFEAAEGSDAAPAVEFDFGS